MLEARIRKAVDALLRIEHRRFAAQVGFLVPASESVSIELLTEVIYSIDELSWSKDEIQRGLAVQMIALTWEHVSPIQREVLRDLLVTSLARIGVSPSITMLESGVIAGRMLSPLHSYAAELASTLMQVEFSEYIGNIEYVLTRFQKSVLDGVEQSRIVGISAPTSAGKSFALYLAIIRHALRRSTAVVYIVPTISLINQVSADLRGLLDSHRLDMWSVRTGLRSIDERCVYVLTQERTLPGVEGSSDAGKIGFLIVDEIQNLERVQDENDLRAKVLYDAMRELRQLSPDARIVLSGPRVTNVGDLGRQIFGVEGSEVATTQSPVANLTYGVSERTAGLFLKQYSAFYPAGRSLRIECGDHVKGLGQTRYTPDYIEYLRRVVENTGETSSNIIFAPTSEQARKTAIDLAASRTTSTDGAVKELAAYLAETIHPKYQLVNAVKHGIGFHSSRVPPHARLVIEQAFSDGLLKDVVCTTTLMQGVNLPANLVVVRNPQLFINKRADGDNPRLSQYEFANLRGRAGRLMKDFVGRTLVLDEDSFLIESGQEELFPNAATEVASGYKDLFARNRETVEAELISPGAATGGASKFLATYIRQTLLRHGEGASGRLRDVGVELSPSSLQGAFRGLRELDISREVCLANRYWDPFDLQSIKDNISGCVLKPLPNEPWSGDEKLLEDWLRFQLQVVPYYFARYLGDTNEQRLRTLSISAVSWARERPLSDIIRKRYFTGDISAKVEQQITDIHRYVVYGVPALLKPIADLQDSGHGFLASIESGVFNPATRLLIERGLYRETAIHVQRKALSGVSGEGVALVLAVTERLQDIGGFSFWVRRQLEPVVKQLKREV